jgi:hypothetical protein
MFQRRERRKVVWREKGKEVQVDAKDVGFNI